MKISICIPVFNRERLAIRAIRSCLEEAGEDFEIVVTDDGSTDRSVDAINKLADPRIKLVRHATNLGICAARNSCVVAAVGDWIVFLDSDDELLPGGLDTIRKAALDSHDDVDCLQFMYHRDDGGCSPDPPFIDGVLTYDGYLRLLEQWTRFDPLFCMRKEAVNRLRWRPWLLSGTILQRFEIHSHCHCVVSSQVVALIHTDANNRISWYRREPKVAHRAGSDLGEEMDVVLQHHGKRLRELAPKIWLRFQRVRASYYFLEGRRVAGIHQSLYCIGLTPFATEVWLQLLMGLLGPRWFAWIRSFRSPPT